MRETEGGREEGREEGQRHRHRRTQRQRQTHIRARDTSRQKQIDKKFIRKDESKARIANPSKIIKELKWKRKYNLLN